MVAGRVASNRARETHTTSLPFPHPLPGPTACTTVASRRPGRRRPPSPTRPASSTRPPRRRRRRGRRVGQVRERESGGEEGGLRESESSLSRSARARARVFSWRALLLKFAALPPPPYYSPHNSHTAPPHMSALFLRRPVFNRSSRRCQKTDCSGGPPAGWRGWIFSSAVWDGGRGPRRRRCRRGR